MAFHALSSSTMPFPSVRRQPSPRSPGFPPSGRLREHYLAARGDPPELQRCPVVVPGRRGPTVSVRLSLFTMIFTSRMLSFSGPSTLLSPTDRAPDLAEVRDSVSAQETSKKWPSTPSRRANIVLLPGAASFPFHCPDDMSRVAQADWPIPGASRSSRADHQLLCRPLANFDTSLCQRRSSRSPPVAAAPCPSRRPAAQV